MHIAYRDIRNVSILHNGPDIDIDWVRSIEVDSTVGDDRKSSKKSKSKRLTVSNGGLKRLTGASMPSNRK